MDVVCFEPDTAKTWKPERQTEPTASRKSPRQEAGRKAKTSRWMRCLSVYVDSC